MLRKVLFAFICLALVAVLYLLFYPTPIEPVAWEAPESPGYTNEYGPNTLLKRARLVALPDGLTGPESIAINEQGELFFPSHQGHILKLSRETNQISIWLDLKSRPLGVEFDKNGNLIVADAAKGLISISPDKQITVLSDQYQGQAYGFIDDLAIARDGRIFFSDASSKPWIQDLGVTPYRASQLDIAEHGGHGKLYVYHPQTQQVELLLAGLQFANGVALSRDEDFVLVNESGSYQVTRFWLDGEKAGQSDIFIGNLPGIPDNITSTSNGSFWLALIQPRNIFLDYLAPWPSLRKVIGRLPEFLVPVGQPYDYVVRLDAGGSVLQTLQDPDAAIGQITSAIEQGNELYLGSLSAPVMGIYTKPNGF